MVGCEWTEARAPGLTSCDQVLDLVIVDVCCVVIVSDRPTGSAPIAPTPFLERPRKGEKKSPLAVGALAPAGSTIELRDGSVDDPECV